MFGNIILSTDSYNVERALERKPDSSDMTWKQLVKDEADSSGKQVHEAEAFKQMVQLDTTDAQIMYNLLSGGKLVGMKTPKIKEFFGDFLSVKDFPQIVGPAMELVMKSYIMPQLTVSREVFNTVPYTGVADEVRISTIGPIEVEEIAHGEPYPGTGTAIEDIAYKIRLEIKKYGRKMEIEQELMDSDNWGILRFYMSQIADGFVMRKEDTCMNLLNKMGVTIFNNAAPSGSYLQKITTGRNISGLPNGALSLTDMIDMWVYGNQRGFNYSVMLIHPFAWPLFANDPEIREIVLNGSVASQTSAPRHSGNGAPGFEDPFGQWGYVRQGFGNGPTSGSDPNVMFGKLGIVPFTNQLTPWGASFMLQPKGFGTPIRVIVTPRVPFMQDPTSKKYITNFYLIDPSRTGILLQGEGPATIEWDDVEREIHSIAFKERWGVAPLYQGRGVAVARNIVIERNYVFENVNQVSLNPFPINLTGAYPGWGA